MFATNIRYNTVPALQKQASSRKSHVLADGELVLTGALAARAPNAYLRENEDADFDSVARLDAHFIVCRAQNEGSEFSHLPKRLFVGREDRDRRSRPLA